MKRHKLGKTQGISLSVLTSPMPTSIPNFKNMKSISPDKAVQKSDQIKLNQLSAWQLRC